MDEFLVTVYMVLGILLRIGTPFAITFLLAFYLRRLDAKWRAEALQAQPGEVALHQMWLNDPCWEAKDCVEEQREKCPAFIQTLESCWEVHRENGGLHAKCRECEYRKELLIPIAIFAKSSQS